MNCEQPPALRGEPGQQLAQLASYLFRLVQYLNTAEPERAEPGGGDPSALLTLRREQESAAAGVRRYAGANIARLDAALAAANGEIASLQADTAALESTAAMLETAAAALETAVTALETTLAPIASALTQERLAALIELTEGETP